MPMSWYEYMIKAAEHSKYNAKHWFRYLRKVIFEDKTYIDSATYKKLMASDKLTMFQKVTLQRALVFNSPTHQYIVSLNQPAKLFYVEKLRDMIEKGEIHGK